MYRVSSIRLKSPPTMAIIRQLSMSLGLASFLSWIYFNITNDGRRALHQLHPNPLLNLGLLLFAIGPLAHITRLRLSKKTRFSTALIHSLTQFVLLVAIIRYTGFVLNVTHKTDATDLPGKTYKEYHSVDGYSGSFRPYGSRPNSTRDPVWIDIRKSLSNSKICEKFADKYKNLTASEFYNSHFSIIEAACCKPPLLNCELHYKNSGFWYESYLDLIPNSETIGRPRSLMVAGFLLGSPPPRVGTPFSENLNCSSWDNKHRCFSCEECYSGVLDNIRKEWRQMAVLNIFVIFITIVFFILSMVRRRQLVGIKPTG